MIKHLVILTGPSGVGKATIEKKLFANNHLKLMFSCSATTRSPRKNEKEGRDYYFLSAEQFEEKIKNHEFLEWNQHFSHKYGTLKVELERIEKKGYIPFLEIDVEGAKQIIKKYQKNINLITIFIMPPSIQELERRMRERNTENENQLKERLIRYHKEIDDAKYFDFTVVNHDIDRVVEKIRKIIRERIYG